MYNDLKEYLEKLENDSFEGWTEDEKKGYLTCLVSVKEFIKDTEK